MNKPSWNDAPEWARYLAQDGDGRWYWYQMEPEMLSDQWCENSSHGRVQEAFVLGGDWVNSLERRP